MLRVRALVDLRPSERGSMEVWMDSLGLFAGGCDEGIIDKVIAAAAPVVASAAVDDGDDVESESGAGRVVQVRP